MHWIWLFEYGSCFQFNSGLNLTNQKIDLVNVTRTESGYGFSLVILFQTLFSLESQIGSIVNETVLARNDFLIFVHNSSHSNRISSATDFVYLEYGEVKPQRLLLSIERTLMTRQPAPYSECIDLNSYSSQYYDYIIASNYSYRQIDCIDLSMQEQIILACNCYDLRYPNLNETQTQPCLTLTQYDCADGEVNSFDKSTCVTKHCPLELLISVTNFVTVLQTMTNC